MTRRYHHGDLRAALVDTAVELIEEQGVNGFSLAEASRRLGVAVSAPYAHFADRGDLLAAVAVRGFELFHADVGRATGRHDDPADRLAALARCYVRYAHNRRPYFLTQLDAGLDKRRHPEIAAAERPVAAAFLDCVADLCDDDPTARALATAVEATAHGHAMLLLAGDLGHGRGALRRAGDSAARATLALVEGRRLLA